MKALLLFLVLPFVLGIALAHGAVIVVDPSQDLQSVVNSANSGDELVLADGIYNEAVINNKNLNIRNLSGTPQITSLRVSNSSAICEIKNVRITTDLNATAGMMRMLNCQISGSINATTSSIELIKTTVTGNANFGGGIRTEAGVRIYDYARESLR